MAHLSERIKALSESQTIAMARKSRELQAQGIDIISLSLGEPDFNTPEVIKQAAKKALDDNYTYYTHVSGYQELREAICKKFKRDNNLIYTAVCCLYQTFIIFIVLIPLTLVINTSA